MRFRSRFKGDLKFSAKVSEREISMSFPVKVAQPIELLSKTVEMYQDSIRKQAKAGKIVALDNEAKEFVAAKSYKAETK